MKTLTMMAMGIMFLFVAGGAAYGQPAPTMYTVDNIYYYLVEGTEASWGAHSLEPQSGVPGGAVPGYSKNLVDIYDDTKAGFDSCTAVPGQVMDTATFFSTDTGNWGPKAGTIATQTVSNATVSQSAGYYNAFNLSTVDTDLAAGNIKNTVVIYGVTGTAVSGGLLKTGQTFSYQTGDDGYYEKGTAFSYQTSDPAANGDIVTTDNVTGLMWASNGTGAGCYSGGIRTWTLAITWAEGLTFAGYSDWRLPNRRELESIVDSSRDSPAINTVYFPNTASGNWWSGSTLASSTANAWGVYFSSGNVVNYSKSGTFYVRAVRGGG